MKGIKIYTEQSQNNNNKKGIRKRILIEPISEENYSKFKAKSKRLLEFPTFSCLLEKHNSESVSCVSIMIDSEFDSFERCEFLYEFIEETISAPYIKKETEFPLKFFEFHYSLSNIPFVLLGLISMIDSPEIYLFYNSGIFQINVFRD